MRELVDSVDIDVAPEVVWAWLLDLPTHYREWHPDHLRAEWVAGHPGEIGSVLRVEELLHGAPHTLRMQILERREEPGRMVLSYRAGGAMRALIAAGRFEVTRRARFCTFTAGLQFRAPWLTERLFGARVRALQEHMRAEGVQLKALLERPAPSA